jgi:cellulose synthase/poly-beta-1,6-N-acetylglucosamine synthase-like glycosyltransferase
MNIYFEMTWMCLIALAYHYFGYPLIVFLMSRLMPHPVRRETIEPRVSFIVAAYNEAAVIGQKLDNTLALDYPRHLLEIIIVTDGSHDETANIAADYHDQGVILLHQPERRGKSAAINRAVERATGEILVFSDANAFYRDNALRMLVRHFSDPSTGCVSGKKTIRPTAASVTESESIYWKYESFIKSSESRLGMTTAIVGEMMALRKEHFSPIPAGIINDDAYLALNSLRSGYRVIYEPAAVCWETSAQSMHDEVIRRRRMNAGAFQLFFRFSLWPWNRPLAVISLVSHKYMRLFLPILMAGALLGNLGYVMTQHEQGLLEWVLVGQVFVYAVAIIGWFGERYQQRWKIPALAYYVVRASLTPLEGLWGFIRRTQSPLWEKVNRGNQT